MQRLIASILATFPLLATMALAAAVTDTGAIKKLNASKGTIELSGGKTFAVPKSISLHAFKVNEKIMVTYTMTNGKMLVTRILAAK